MDLINLLVVWFGLVWFGSLVSPSDSQSVGWSVSESVSHLVTQSFSQLFSQSVIYSVRHLVSQSISNLLSCQSSVS
jgi:hypothetical protein